MCPYTANVLFLGSLDLLDNIRPSSHLMLMPLTCCYPRGTHEFMGLVVDHIELGGLPFEVCVHANNDNHNFNFKCVTSTFPMSFFFFFSFCSILYHFRRNASPWKLVTMLSRDI